MNTSSLFHLLRPEADNERASRFMKRQKLNWNSILNPAIAPEVTAALDKRNIENMFYLSWVICVFEVLVLLSFTVPALVKGTFSRSDLISALSVLYCIAVCAVFATVTGRIRKKASLPHDVNALLTVLYYLLMSVWAMYVTLRHYRLANDQMSTFFSVVLCFVCFISFRPVLSIILTFVTYAGLYFMLWSVDQGAAVDGYNFSVLALVTAMCFVIQYRQRVRSAEATLELRTNYEQLRYVSRHDALTGARNRTSLAEDTPSFTGKPLTVIMTDIDYFKQFNDRYGHTVGDEVLAEMFTFIKTVFPSCTAYRYGGDEFLILLPNTAAVDALNVLQSNSGFPKTIGEETAFVRIGFGISGGIPADENEFSALISEADQRLYEMKRETHKND